MPASLTPASARATATAMSLESVAVTPPRWPSQSISMKADGVTPAARPASPSIFGCSETHRPLSGVRRYAHGIGHVPKTVLREVLRLRQRGDGYRSEPGRVGAPGDVDGFRGFHMWTQHDTPR